ncbi:MAG: fadE, partial [Gammaproteobacteria bacterium]|nr:fadE [Gammaproteobacteria bacterium]
ATLLGLAFKLYDPEGLLGENTYIGITSVLIPTSHPGVIIGRRHFIGNGFFINGPTSGKDVFIPLEWIIGGVAQKGQGWRMLTESLSAGRAMALPGASIGGCYAATLATSAYAFIRQQFKVPIGRFEGIQEKLALMAIGLYQMESMTYLTLSAVDQGEKPSVLSAIVKYYTTETARRTIQAAMDVHGGKGICMGARNYLSDGFALTPIAITVEGANILTRNMIIFGQGAVRCHRYMSTCLQAINNSDVKQGLADFDKAVWGHVAHFISLWPRLVWQSLSGGWFIWPERHPYWRALQKLTLRSNRFAFLTEICFLVYRDKLKFAERVSARMADNFIHLYAASSALKYAQEKEVLTWTPTIAKELNKASLSENWFALDKAGFDLLSQLPNRRLAKCLSLLCFPWGRKRAGVKDKQKKVIATALLMNTAMTAEIEEKIYIGANANSVLAKLIHTHREALLCEPLYQKEKEGSITAAEKLRLQALEQAIADIIAVDDFPAHAFSRV